MKKIFTLCLVLLCGMLVHAQQNPNRILIHESAGSHQGYLVERVDSITFVKEEGEVKANLELTKVELEKLTVNVTRTPSCVGFKITVIPEQFAKRLGNETVMAKYIDGLQTDIYQQDFKAGEMTGMPVEPNSNYVLATLGYDKYAIPCSVSQVNFTTPAKALVGNPNVEIEVLDRQLTSFTVGFTPNEDTGGYSVMAGDLATLQQQYEMFAGMLGFHNMGDMVKTFGQKFTEAGEFTWNEMEPNTTYAVLVQAWDVEETNAPIIQAEVATLPQGGSGDAVVKIELGEYKLMDWEGEKLPSQFLIYTMNDQTWCYRVATYLAPNYDKDPTGAEKDLKSDPEVPTVGWFMFENFSTDYQINPNTEVVALAAAKNADGVWGETTVLRFTTPAKANMPAHFKACTEIAKRALASNGTSFQAGKLPVLKAAQKGIKLVQK